MTIKNKADRAQSGGEEGKMARRSLTMEERIKLAEEGLDILGKDARIFPPPIYVGENGFPNDQRMSDGNATYIKTPQITGSE